MSLPRGRDKAAIGGDRPHARSRRSDSVSILGKEAGRETKRARAPWTAAVWRDKEDDGIRGPCLYMTSGKEWRR